MSISFVRAGRKALLGRKVGMIQVFNAQGGAVPATVIEVGPCTVLQIKTVESDGYASLQVGFLDTTKRPLRPQQGHYKKCGVKAKKFVREIPIVGPEHVLRVPVRAEAGGTVEFRDLEAAADGGALRARKVPRSQLVLREVVAVEGKSPALLVKDSSGAVVKEYALSAGASIEVAPGATVADGDLLAYVPAAAAPTAVEPGMQIGVALFKDCKKVDVSGISKGRGFQGTIKRHNFNAGPKSHGTKNIREPGSSGHHTDPARVFPGKRMPGHMGAARTKSRALHVVDLDPAMHLLLVEGAVPGPPGAFVVVQESLRKK